MAGIGDLFGGIAEGYATGSQLINQRADVALRAKSIQVEQEKAQMSLELMRRQVEDMKAVQGVMQDNSKDAQQDATAYGILDQAHQLASLDKNLRGSQLDTFAAAFKQQTGQDLAPNVISLFKSATPEQLTAIVDKATMGMLKNPQADLNSLLTGLTDPTAAAGMVAQLGGEVTAESKGVNLTSPQETAVQRQIAVMNNSRSLLQRQADRLQAALGKISTPEMFKSTLSQWTTLQGRIDTIDAKIADLSKPVSLGRGGSLVDPTTNETLVERSALKSPAEMQQEVDLAARKAEATTAARQKGLSESGGIFSPEEANFMAQQYLTTGQMPGTGMGTVGQINRVAVVKAAREIAQRNGMTGRDAALGVMENKTTQQAMGQLKKGQAMVNAFEKTAMANAQQVRELSAKVDRTGSPVINRWLLAGRKALAGDPDVAKFDLAVRTFANEYAKVTTSVTGGGVTSDTARKEIDAVINNAQTAEQIEGVIQQAIVEMKNRTSAFQSQLQELRGSAPGQGEPTVTLPGAAPAPAQGAPSSEAPAPQTFANLPPPAQVKDKILRDTTTGRRFRSDGVRYHPVQ